MSAYYNEHDPKAAAWIRELIAAGEIPDGKVDERSITDVTPDDLVGFTQCHFFAGVAGWSKSLRLANWPEERPIWTGSAPCQPFSVAGKGKGHKDERHLWPAFFQLIKACRPEVVLGEQVASPDVVGSELEAAFVVAVQRGDFAKANKLAKRLTRQSSFSYTRRWLDGVQADLVSASYAFGACDIPAAGVGAPHIRQRIYWLAIANGAGRQPRLGASTPAGYGNTALATGGDSHGMAHAQNHGAPGSAQAWQPDAERSGATDRLAEPHDAERRPDAAAGHEQHGAAAGRQQGDGESRAGRAADGVGNAESDDERRQRERGASDGRNGAAGGSGAGSACERLGDSTSRGCGIERDAAQSRSGGHTERAGGTGPFGLEHSALSAGSRLGQQCEQLPRPTNTWSEFAIIGCRAGKSRRIPQLLESDVQPGADGLPGSVDGRWIESDGIVWPLAKGIKGRTGLLRGAGNAIQCELAAEFIRGVASIL